MARTTVINVRHPENMGRAAISGLYVPIHRPSKWGNPFSHKEGTLAQWRVRSRAEAIERYAQWFVNQPDLVRALPELRGRILGCFCRPLPCHGDLLAKWADEGLPEQVQASLF